MAIAEAVVAADDFAFINYLWSTWSPGYDASEDLPRVKDCLRDRPTCPPPWATTGQRSTPPVSARSRGWPSRGRPGGPSPPSPPSTSTAPRTAPTLLTTPTSPRLAAYWPRDQKPPGWKAPAISCSWRNPPK